MMEHEGEKEMSLDTGARRIPNKQLNESPIHRCRTLPLAYARSSAYATAARISVLETMPTGLRLSSTIMRRRM
jgi:hypothetical protein